MGYSQIVEGHVGSIARGINVANAQPNRQGVATVNPILHVGAPGPAHPVRIEIDRLPEGVVLVAGMTCHRGDRPWDVVAAHATEYVLGCDCFVG